MLVISAYNGLYHFKHLWHFSRKQDLNSGCYGECNFVHFQQIAAGFLQFYPRKYIYRTNDHCSICNAEAFIKQPSRGDITVLTFNNICLRMVKLAWLSKMHSKTKLKILHSRVLLKVKSLFPLTYVSNILQIFVYVIFNIEQIYNFLLLH